MSKEDKLKRALEKVGAIRPMGSKDQPRPHKFLFLLALARMYEDSPNRPNSFPLDDELERYFSTTCEEYLTPDSASRVLIEYPFYHLSNDGVWNLKIRADKIDLFRDYKESKNKRFTNRRLQETVECGFLDDDLDSCFRCTSLRETLSSEISTCLSAERLTTDAFSAGRGNSQSLFAHEEIAIRSVRSSVEANHLGEVLSNLELHDPQSNRYFETDFILIAVFGFYVVELKHWSGRIQVRPNSWVQNNSFFKPDPHKANGFKAKLVRGIYEHEFPAFPSMYVESVVVLTNPEASVEGASLPKTDSHNPTFDSISRFIDYLKHQRRSVRSRLEGSQVITFAKRLAALHRTAPPRDFVFPGYEVVERLYHHDDRAEVVARATDVRYRHLTRLRIFFPPAEEAAPTASTFLERATATLNAVAKTGDHPNILKVWPVPNENQYIVEGSDWSETGTLRDVILSDGKVELDRAVSIAAGILEGLAAIHNKDVIHRAVSPENILMAGDVPKLMNFDLSYQLEEDRATVIPDASALSRSPYISPEIYQSGPLTEAADLFSVGVILYELLTGERPFRCSTDLEQTGGKLHSRCLQKLETLNLGSRLQALLGELIQLDPNARPTVASGVLKSLGQVTQREVTPSAVNPVLQPGDRSGLFEIVELVKKGAQSQIYRARGPQERVVAVKLFNADVPLSQVVKEQGFAAAVNHPAVVKVDSYNSWLDKRFYIAFRWVEGTRLRDEIESGRRPGLADFERVACAVIDALQVLHYYQEDGQSEPILHNDIKPENLFLSQSGQPLLIDFGSATHPGIGLYEGTEGYVAPDLRLGEDRQYCEEGDLFALGMTLFEWFFGEMPYRELVVGAAPDLHKEANRDMPSRLLEWFRKAVATESGNRFRSAIEMKRRLQRALTVTEPKAGLSETEADPAQVGPAATEEGLSEVKKVSFTPPTGQKGNPFVAYLNSLQCLTAGSENALAEFQARNSLFGLIHVSHPVGDRIQEILTAEEPCHVILTGHAGDGKSTIAVSLLKRFLGISDSEPLGQELHSRENLEVNGIRIVLVKDLSEWPPNERLSLLKEMLSDGAPRFFLISNTGTLLDTFREHEREGDWARVESDLLTVFESGTPVDLGSPNLEFHGMHFAVFNLSMVDNLPVAESIFRRMTAPERWEECTKRKCRDHCPIYRNVRLIQQNAEVVVPRLFLTYRRMYEYGSKFTLRQLTAHLAYLITAGLCYEDIAEMSKRAKRPLMSDFMFFNRFFGDNGSRIDPRAQQLRVVRDIRKEAFGSRPCPTWERTLWVRTREDMFSIGAKGCDDEFRGLRLRGARLVADEDIAEEAARQQVRRMIYFLHDFHTDASSAFLQSFLNSLMLMDFMRWQTQPNGSLSLVETTNLKQRVLHVLQEHFTGVRLPEGAESDGQLFITLSRRTHEVRQSAQVVLARFPKDDFHLHLVESENCGGGPRRDLVLEGREARINANLRLDLPFLDYVMQRNQGEIGRDLQASYVDRLERFKGLLIRHANKGQGDDIMLLRLQTNHTFRRQIYAVRDNRLEVIDG